MSRSTFSGPVKSTGGFIAGSDGTTITKILKGTVTVDLADLATVTAADKTMTITGAAAGDIVVLNPKTAALTAGMLIAQAHVSATDEVTVRVYNASGGSINEASATWYYLIIKS
jgi:hypothetical protein